MIPKTPIVVNGNKSFYSNLDSKKFGSINKRHQKLRANSCLSPVHECKQMLHDTIAQIRNIHNRMAGAS